MDRLIANDRFWLAIRALVSGEHDCRARVVFALEVLDALRPSELDADLQDRLNVVRRKASTKGISQVGNLHKNAYAHTAAGRKNKTYVAYANEIFSIYEELAWRHAMKNKNH